MHSQPTPNKQPNLNQIKLNPSKPNAPITQTNPIQSKSIRSYRTQSDQTQPRPIQLRPNNPTQTPTRTRTRRHLQPQNLNPFSNANPNLKANLKPQPRSTSYRSTSRNAGMLLPPIFRLRVGQKSTALCEAPSGEHGGRQGTPPEAPPRS